METKTEKGGEGKDHERNISEDTQEPGEIELLLEAWRAKYTIEDEQETMEPRNTTEVEDQSHAADRQAQKQQDEAATQGRHQQTQGISQ